MLWTALRPPGDDNDELVAIVMAEQKKEPPPPDPPPPPPPIPEEEKVAPPPPKAPTKAEQPEPEEPPPSPKPLRVVGLSLESTSEGGDGPSFAVGDTRSGRTDERAQGPARAAPAATKQTVSAAAKRPAAGPNKAATAIPVAGIKQVLPKRRRPVKPPYPASLKSQGVEADVTVMITLDAAGQVTSVKIIAPSPHEAFNAAARKAAESEQFEPATRDGVAVPYTLSFTYRFRLET
jgi:protein TonB